MHTKADGALDAIAVFGWEEQSGLIASLHDAGGRRVAGPWRHEVPAAPAGFDRVVTALDGRPARGAGALTARLPASPPAHRLPGSYPVSAFPTG